MPASPSQARLMGKSLQDAVKHTNDMREVSVAEDPVFRIPYMDFAGVPVGIDIKEIAGDDYSAVRDSNSDPIVLSRKGQRSTCEYRPDVIAEHDFPAALDVYEIVDSEPVSKGVLDITHFLATPGRCKMPMICSNREKLKTIQDSARVLLYNLEGEKEFAKHCLFTTSGTAKSTVAFVDPSDGVA